MKIGATMAFNHYTRPQYIGEAARAVEAAGFHSIWVPEHVLFFPEYGSKYPYTDNGRIPGEPEGVLDPFTALTFVAAQTSTVRLATGVCLVPQRQPVYTAKMVADLDYLSGGRVDFGIGIGWLEEEFDALGMSFAQRAKRCDEYVRAMKELWSPGLGSFKGETVEFDGCHFNPKPVQEPHPPIVFGGESGPALRRVATLGNAWYGFNLTPAELSEKLVKLDEALDKAGRSRSDIQVFVGSNAHPVTPETAAAYEEAGADQLIVPVMAGKLEKLQARIERVREATGL